MISSVEFDLNPRLYFTNDESAKKMKFNNKHIDSKLKNNIIKDVISNKFKKYLYDTIFDTPDDDAISEYLDGKNIEIKYNNTKSNFRVIIKLYLLKSFDNEKELLKLINKKNITNMIKENINHIYRSRGHYKEYKLKDSTVVFDLSLISENDKNTINNFKLIN